LNNDDDNDESLSSLIHCVQQMVLQIDTKVQNVRSHAVDIQLENRCIRWRLS